MKTPAPRLLHKAIYGYVTLAVVLMSIGLICPQLLWMSAQTVLAPFTPHTEAWNQADWSVGYPASVSLLILALVMTPPLCVLTSVGWSTRKYFSDRRDRVRVQIAELRNGGCRREFSNDYRTLVKAHRVGTMLFVLTPLFFVGYGYLVLLDHPSKELTSDNRTIWD